MSMFYSLLPILVIGLLFFSLLVLPHIKQRRTVIPDTFTQRNQRKLDEVEYVDHRTEEGKLLEKAAQFSLENAEEEAAALEICSHHTAAQRFRGPESEKYQESQYLKIKKIGQQLYESGGHKRMLRVAYRVKALAGDLAGRYVESYWNGIGEWTG
jgi:hypothetical protein